MNRLRITLLGSVGVSIDGEAGELRLTRRAISLLSYLVLHRDRRFTREVLTAVFWGDHDERHARRCLNTALWRLRRVLEPRTGASGRWLRTNVAGEIGFTPDEDCAIDVDRFERLVRGPLAKPAHTLRPAEIAGLEEAVAVYAGDLLEGFYDDWILAERERLRRAYGEALTQLVRYHAEAAHPEASLDFARRLLAVDPLREEAHRAVIRGHAAIGQRELALKQYAACRAILAGELGVTPSPETEELRWRLTRRERVPARVAGDASLLALSEALGVALTQLDEASQRVRDATRLVDAARAGTPPDRQGPDLSGDALRRPLDEAGDRSVIGG